MSSYLTNSEWELFLDTDEDSLEDYYEELEKTDKKKRQKKQTKMREYEGYTEDE